MKGYDAWKTTDRADEALGRSNGKPHGFRCLDCDWRGKGVMARAEHYGSTWPRHHIVFADDPRPSGPARKEVA